MPLPPIEAERWRLVEQKLAEFGVDIQRLWRQVQQVQRGGPASDGTLTPAELEALTGAGTGGGTATRPVYHLIIRGAATGGTISWYAATRGVPGSTTGTINFDDDHTDVETALSGFDPDVQCEGGSLLWNAVRICFSDPDMVLHVTGDTDLVREDYSPQPKAELVRCEEPESRWD